MAVAIEPGLVGLESLHVAVEAEGRLTRGMTVADLRDIEPYRKAAPHVPGCPQRGQRAVPSLLPGAPVPRVCVIGSANVDYAVAPSRGCRIRERRCRAARSLVNLGGKGANQAVAARRLGGEVRLIGCVGDDGRRAADIKDEPRRGGHRRGRPLRHGGRGHRHRHHHGRRRRAATRSPSRPGANHRLTVEMVATLRGEHRVGGRRWPASSRPRCRWCAGRSVASAASRRHHRAQSGARAAPRRRSSWRSWTTSRRTRGEAGSARRDRAVDSLESAGAAAARLLADGAGVVLVTLGEQGALACDGEQASHFPGVPRGRRSTPTAAGDAFSGALAVGLGRGRLARAGDSRSPMPRPPWPAHGAGRRIRCPSARTSRPSCAPSADARDDPRAPRLSPSRCAAPPGGRGHRPPPASRGPQAAGVVLLRPLCRGHRGSGDRADSPGRDRARRRGHRRHVRSRVQEPDPGRELGASAVLASPPSGSSSEPTCSRVGCAKTGSGQAHRAPADPSLRAGATPRAWAMPSRSPTSPSRLSPRRTPRRSAGTMDPVILRHSGPCTAPSRADRAADRRLPSCNVALCATLCDDSSTVHRAGPQHPRRSPHCRYGRGDDSVDRLGSRGSCPWGPACFSWGLARPQSTGICPPPDHRSGDGAGVGERRLRQLGPMRRIEWLMLSGTLLVISLWIGGSRYTDATTAALLGVVLLVVRGVVSWDEHSRQPARMGHRDADRHPRHHRRPAPRPRGVRAVGRRDRSSPWW